MNLSEASLSTQIYRDILSVAQLAWISGSVFGYFSLSNTPQFYPAWWPAVWNTACLTASPHLGTFRININGLTVWKTEDVTSNLFQKEKVRSDTSDILLKPFTRTLYS